MRYQAGNVISFNPEWPPVYCKQRGMYICMKRYVFPRSSLHLLYRCFAVRHLGEDGFETLPKGGFPRGEIFRPNRNFSLFHELSSRTNCKKTKRNFVLVEKFRLVESGLKVVVDFLPRFYHSSNAEFRCLCSCAILLRLNISMYLHIVCT